MEKSGRLCQDSAEHQMQNHSGFHPKHSRDFQDPGTRSETVEAFVSVDKVYSDLLLMLSEKKLIYNC